MAAGLRLRRTGGGRAVVVATLGGSVGGRLQQQLAVPPLVVGCWPAAAVSGSSRSTSHE